MHGARIPAALVQAELLEVAKLPALVEFALRSFGGLDVLINNASTFYPTPIGEITPQTWDDLLGTNLKVPTFLSQAAAPALRQSRGSSSTSSTSTGCARCAITRCIARPRPACTC
jgi:NAD(P)-dependent dehydrogenase (short-subunit alcohol dehydrogenase family)